MRATRRTMLLGLIAIGAAACVQGKLVHTAAFEVTYEARSNLDRALQAWALSERFKIGSAGDPSSVYWPAWTFTSDDIDISIAPMNEEPATVDAPPPRGPLAYAAQFYDHSALGGAARLPAVIASFTRTLSAVDGVRKLRDDQAA